MATTKRFSDNNEKTTMASADILPFEQISDETDKKITFGNLNKQILHNADVECSNNQETPSITVKLKDNSGTEIASSTVAVPLNTVNGEINGIKAKIPSSATESNKLADKEFVNSSIATNTANFKGTFDTLAELEAVTGATNNDYGFVKSTDSTGNTSYKRYKYNASEEEWVYEYDLNNSSFTADQWGAINSGVTSGKLEEIDEAIASIGSTVPEPTAKDKLLISNEELEWVEINKNEVGEVTTRCTKAEWEAKTEAERIALSGSAVDILDDYSEADNNVYSTEETVVGKWIDGKKIYRKVCEVNSPSSTGWQDIITGLTYIDNLIKIYGYMIRDTYIDFIPYGESGYEVIPEYIKNENKLKIKIGNSSRCNKPCKLILEYTKTTD